MTEYVGFLLLGLGNGAVFGALAMAIVLTFRSSGVLNFATGSIALYGAYVYVLLRKGEFLVLVPGLPKTLDLGTDDLGQWPSMAIAVAMSALLGLLLYVVVFRPLRTSPALAKAVAALGVGLLISALVVQQLGTSQLTTAPILPIDVWELGDITLQSDRVWLAVTVLGIAAVLTALFKFTRFGLATRASAESERGAYLSGVSPDRVAALNWMISSATAGLVGILIVPITPLAPFAFTLLIVPALAAAVAARFQILIVAVVAGLVIGAIQSALLNAQFSHDWIPSGSADLVPLILVIAVLAIGARPLPTRGAIITNSLGRAPMPRRVLPTTLVAGTVGLLALILIDSDRLRAGLITSFIFAIIALSMVVVTGYAGQVSLTQLPIAGVAGFIVTTVTDDFHIPFPLAPIVAALIAMALGILIALPALRIRGLLLAVVTIAFAVALQNVWFTNGDIVSGSGIEIPEPKIFGYSLDIGGGDNFPQVRFGIMVLVVLILVAVGVALLRRSALGSQMLAVRANERSAAAAGVAVTRTKLMAFAIGAFIAGLGGALLAYQRGNVSFEIYAAVAGLVLFSSVYLAGITSVSGGILAGVLVANGLVYIAVDEVWTLSGWYPVIAALLLVATVILNPEGIVGPVHALIAKLGRPDGPVSLDVTETHRLEKLAPREFTDVPAALEISGLTVRYGGVVAVDSVDITVPEGAIVGLIGPNGAGKTTFIDAVTGLAPCTGSVRLGDADLAGQPTYKRVRQGLGRTFQAVELYDDLSVTENVRVGLAAAPSDSRKESGQRLDRLLDRLGLDGVKHRPASDLSQGQRQLVSISRALAGNPKVLLLDEPAGGLDSNESQWLGERLRTVRDAGVTILMVDHDMDLVLGLCDLVYVLNFGKVIAAGPPDAIRADRTVVAAYLGGTHDGEGAQA
ncbi:MAG: cysA1 [Aeromicrobium sp.]|nr:cysA1 [Aeromicrobium sp.]